LDGLDEETKTELVSSISGIESSLDKIKKKMAERKAALAKKETEDRRKKEAEELMERLAKEAEERSRLLAETEQCIGELSERLEKLVAFSFDDEDSDANWGEIESEISEIESELTKLQATKASLTKDWTDIKSDGKKSKKGSK
jgi:chromosome segregation ATPase